MQNRIVLVCGFRGSGKSTVASGILRGNDAALVSDPHGDDAYRWIPNTARNSAELYDFSRWRSEAKPETRALMRYVPDGRIDPSIALNDFCQWIWDTWRNVWICVEEVSDGCGKGVAAQGLPPELRDARVALDVQTAKLPTLVVAMISTWLSL